MPPRPVKPANLSAPGINWRARSQSSVAYWVARADIAKRGYTPKSVRLWPPSNGNCGAEPTAGEWLMIGSQCERLQAEMLLWANVGPQNWDPRAIYDGTMTSLIRIYEKDPDSPYQGLREATYHSYDSHNRTLVATIGKARIPELTFRDFKRWYEGFCTPRVAGEHERKARGHGLMTHVRIVIGFGALLQLPGCRAAKEILSDMEFKTPKRREEIVTRAQAIAICAEAHRHGYHSIAFAQALMTGLGWRQKDAIGEYVRRNQPGLSDITDGRDKWIIGARHNEIEGTTLTHRLSKSIRGSKAVADLNEGKVKRYDLSLYPMIVEELARIPLEQRVGPLIVAEHSGKPWRQKVFGARWRKIARAAGVPDHVQNRDSRASTATEADEAGADVELIRQSLGHARTDTTRIYMRGEDAATAKIAVLRFKNAPKTP